MAFCHTKHKNIATKVKKLTISITVRFLILKNWIFDSFVSFWPFLMSSVLLPSFLNLLFILLTEHHFLLNEVKKDLSQKICKLFAIQQLLF